MTEIWILIWAKWDFFRKSATDLTAAALVLVFMALVRFFRRLPNRLLYNYKKRNHLTAFRKASEIGRIMSYLSRNGKGIRSHIIRYHNHGPQKMTIEWESLGHTICEGCEIRCGSFNNIKGVQDEWQGFRLSDLWLDIVSKTVHNDRVVNYVTDEAFDLLHKQFWSATNTHMYKEQFIKYKYDGFYALGISYCERFKDINGTFSDPDVLIAQATNKLKRLL